MSEVKVNKISPRAACGTTTLGDSGDTFNIPCGSKINVASGGNITVASGATITNNGTQTGFGRTGTVDWQTGSIKTSTFTAANGEGYFANTSGGAFNMNLPAGSAGSIVSVADYTRTFQTYALTVVPNGSDKIGGVAANATLNVQGQAATFVYVDANEGWINVNDSTGVAGRVVTDYIVATGGTITCSGDYKIHTFTGPGTFSVTNEGTPSGSNTVDYLVIAGGGAGAQNYGAGGGAGGYRESSGAASGCYSISPLGSGVAALPVTYTCYAVTVGGGGTGAPVNAPTS